MTAPSIVENVTCLGCGCACDDISVVVHDDHIIEARNACALGTRWFGDGQVPSRCVVDGRDVPLPEAVLSAATVLSEAARALVYLAPGVSCESQREVVAIADLLQARLDTITSATASRFVLAGQERGYASATLGEIRNRADVVVFWGVDLEHRYPRFASRYAPEPVGMYLERSQRSRTVISVDVGRAASVVVADRRMAVTPADEVAVLTALEALARAPAEDTSAFATLSGAAWAGARELAPALLSARYVALVYDAEPDDRAKRSPRRFDALAALAQALNHRTRCAAIALRGGGNRSGADSVLVAQAGFPFAIDFARGFPRYDPYSGSVDARLDRREVDAALVVGDVVSIPDETRRMLATLHPVAIGPRASQSPLGAAITLDTGIDGIHASGTALRTDDVPLPLRASLPGLPSTVDAVRAVGAAVRDLTRGRSVTGPRSSSPAVAGA